MITKIEWQRIRNCLIQADNLLNEAIEDLGKENSSREQACVEEINYLLDKIKYE